MKLVCLSAIEEMANQHVADHGLLITIWSLLKKGRRLLPRKKGYWLLSKVIKDGVFTDRINPAPEPSLLDALSCMSTRSSARNLVPPLEDPERTVRRRNRGDPALLINFEEINMANNNQNNHDQPPPEEPNVPAPDLQTMKELCQPTLNG
nr:hypothetical protein [Tanacetum cinerariifolium]